MFVVDPLRYRGSTSLQSIDMGKKARAAIAPVNWMFSHGALYMNCPREKSSA